MRFLSGPVRSEDDLVRVMITLCHGTRAFKEPHHIAPVRISWARHSLQWRSANISNIKITKLTARSHFQNIARIVGTVTQTALVCNALVQNPPWKAKVENVSADVNVIWSDI